MGTGQASQVEQDLALLNNGWAELPVRVEAMKRLQPLWASVNAKLSGKPPREDGGDQFTADEREFYGLISQFVLETLERLTARSVRGVVSDLGAAHDKVEVHVFDVLCKGKFQLQRGASLKSWLSTVIKNELRTIGRKVKSPANIEERDPPAQEAMPGPADSEKLVQELKQLGLESGKPAGLDFVCFVHLDLRYQMLRTEFRNGGEGGVECCLERVEAFLPWGNDIADRVIAAGTASIGSVWSRFRDRVVSAEIGLQQLGRALIHSFDVDGCEPITANRLQQWRTRAYKRLRKLPARQYPLLRKLAEVQSRGTHG
jgi:hypothetical protein